MHLTHTNIILYTSYKRCIRMENIVTLEKKENCTTKVKVVHF